MGLFKEEKKSHMARIKKMIKNNIIFAFLIKIKYISFKFKFTKNTYINPFKVLIKI